MTEERNAKVFTFWFTLAVLLFGYGLLFHDEYAAVTGIVLMFVSNTRYQRAEYLRRKYEE